MLFEMGSIELYAGPFHVEQLRKNNGGMGNRVRDGLLQKVDFDGKLWSVAKRANKESGSLLDLNPIVGAAARGARIPSVLPAIA